MSSADKPAMSAEPSVWVRRNGTFTLGVAYFARDRPSGWAAVGEPFYDRATLDAAVAAAVARERERCAKLVDVPPEYEAWEVIGGQECIDMLRELAATIRNFKPD